MNTHDSFLQENLAFLDGQMLMEPSVNEQISFDFQGLRRSYREDPKHPASRLIAQFGRIWLYDVGLSIYADLKAGRIRQAGYQVGRVIQLARQEEAKGFRGLWHFSYNTRGDSFIDPRGPTGANTWCLNAIYAYLLLRPDPSVLEWANRAVRAFLFRQQVMDLQDPRYGLIRAGLYNADDLLRGEEMGYRVYVGDLNHPYGHVILEHCADAAGAFRLAFRATKKIRPQEGPFLEELVHRHDLLLQGMRRSFWQGDHFVSALDPQGQLYAGTDGFPSIAVDNNTWSAHVLLPYDPDAALAAARYVEKRFLIGMPPAQVEDLPPEINPGRIQGLYYFPATFSDPFVQVPEESRGKMERMLQPEAAFGYVLFLLDLVKFLPAGDEQTHLNHLALKIYEETVRLQRLYGSSGAPYASVNVPEVFSTLHSVTTAASAAITTAVLQGAPSDDLVGVRPPEEFTVAGKPPQLVIPAKAGIDLRLRGDDAP